MPAADFREGTGRVADPAVVLDTTVDYIAGVHIRDSPTRRNHREVAGSRNESGMTGNAMSVTDVPPCPISCGREHRREGCAFFCAEVSCRRLAQETAHAP